MEAVGVSHFIIIHSLKYVNERVFVGDTSYCVPDSAEKKKIEMDKWLEFLICFSKHLKAKGKCKKKDNG